MLLSKISGNPVKMSIGSVYETAYKGDYNQVKVRIDEDTSLVKTPDQVRHKTQILTMYKICKSR